MVKARQRQQPPLRPRIATEAQPHAHLARPPPPPIPAPAHVPCPLNACLTRATKPQSSSRAPTRRSTPPHPLDLLHQLAAWRRTWSAVLDPPHQRAAWRQTWSTGRSFSTVRRGPGRGRETRRRVDGVGSLSRGVLQGPGRRRESRRSRGNRRRDARGGGPPAGGRAVLLCLASGFG
jgi:hypothetical protein